MVFLSPFRRPFAVLRIGLLATAVVALGTACPGDGEVDAGVEPDPTAEPAVEPDGGPGPEDDAGPGPEDDGGPGPGPTPDPEPAVVTDCDDTPVPTTAPGTDICAVELGTGTGTLIVGDILTPGEVFEGGAVLLDAAGDIQCVGCGCVAQAADATLVICPDAVVSPGLINAHDHAGWMSDPPWYQNASNDDVEDGLRWEHRHDWRGGIRGNPRISTTGNASGDGKTRGELRFALSGATSTFASGNAGGLLRNLDSFSASTLPGLGISSARYQTFPLDDADRTLRTSGCSYGDIDQPSEKAGFGAYVPHVAEGIDAEARNEFLCLTGQGEGSVDLLGENTAIIHGIGLLPPDVARMASTGIGLVWSPRTNISLYGDTAMVTSMARAGVNIGLGTDWMPSGSMSMLRELSCIDELNANQYGNFFSDRDLWAMATVGSARALGVSARTGALATGRVGDIAIFANNGRSHYRAVIDANPGDVALVMRGGEVLNGNAAVVEALEPGCDTIADVCGSDKRSCVNLPREAGTTVAALEAANGADRYPLFFCDVPVDEPTCVPSRTLAGDVVNDSNLYQGASRVDDPDGDGILDADDNCPTVFNPIRPVDNGGQGDFDNDDIGDACDPCPLDANTNNCEVFNPNDGDADGIEDLADNCPGIPNADQLDTDDDDKGDVCDACPNDANPGAAGCPADISDVKDGTVAVGQAVSIAGLIVTASAPNGYFLQKNIDPAEDFSGIFVYDPALITPAPGTMVDVTVATVAEFFGQLQLTGASVVENGSGTLPAPRVLAEADVIAAVALGGNAAVEGMVVQVENVTVTDGAPLAGPGDDGVNEIEITGGFRVDDGIYSEATYIDPLPTTGELLARVTGPVSFRNSSLKLLPRDANDVVFGAPVLGEFSAPDAYLRDGVVGDTFPVVLEIGMLRAVADPTTVTMTSDNEAAVTVIDAVIAAGELTVAVTVSGVAPGTATITATLGTDTATTSVRVLGAAEAATALTLAPADLTVLLDATENLVVTLDIPAPPGGQTVNVAATGANATVPATVTVLENEQTAVVPVTAVAVGSETITASGVGADVSVDVAIVEVSNVDLDVGDYVVNQTTSNRSFTIPAGTIISAGGYILIARLSNQAAFETFWGVTLADNVTYFASNALTGSDFPSINGEETFSLEDSTGTVIDGPSVALELNMNYQRNGGAAVGAAGDAASWTVSTDAAATPGAGQPLATVRSGLYISEFSDASGAGAFENEFVELHFDGPAE